MTMPDWNNLPDEITTLNLVERFILAVNAHLFA